MYEEFSEIAVSALTDAQQLLLPASGVLRWHQPQPGSKAPPLLKLCSVANWRDNCGGRQRTDTRDREQALAGFILAGRSHDDRVDFLDLILKVLHLPLLLAQLQWEMKHLENQIEEVDAVIVRTSGQDEACQRLLAIPGIGPLTATTIVSAISNGAEFKKGRGFAAWLGLVPAQYSTGGKQKLLGISKRGNCYLRKLLVHGARAVLQTKDKQSSGLSTWLTQLTSRAHSNVAAVALANKLVRMAWAVLAKGEAYRPPLLAAELVGQ